MQRAISPIWSGMSVSIQELDNTVQAFYEGKGDLVGDSKLIGQLFPVILEPC